MEQEAEEEEKKQKEEAEERAKQAPRSEAEAKDRVASARLRAKKEAMQKLKDEVEIKIVLDHEEGVTERTITQTDPIFAEVTTGKWPALIIKKGSGCAYKLQDITIAKLFVEQCKDSSIELAGSARVITDHIEVYKCNGLTLNLQCPVATTQADRCTGVKVNYKEGTVIPSVTQFFHAHCHQLSVNIGDSHSTTYSHQDVDDQDDLAQYVTHLVDGKLVTERVVRPQGWQGRPLTIRQLQGERDKAAAAAAEAKNKGEPIAIMATAAQVEQCEQQLRDAEAMVSGGGVGMDSALFHANEKKTVGNKCFGEAEYGQAVVHYTQALDTLNRAEKARKKKRMSLEAEAEEEEEEEEEEEKGEGKEEEEEEEKQESKQTLQTIGEPAKTPSRRRRTHGGAQKFCFLLD
eukprot:gb/GEZN01001674.1/.p1 GENE.gb/GEZN01001674.1/~~gb/GEZN01001674.1/.p1  ORF type:complete len:404 (-),score=111.72 gb/GEZN01001674.1/:413-1624(-)